MLTYPQLARPPLQEVMENLVNGYPRVVAIEFAKGSVCESDQVYGKLMEEYPAAYHNHMPRYHSMVLVPRRRKVHAVYFERSRIEMVRMEEEEAELGVTVNFSTMASIEMKKIWHLHQSMGCGLRRKFEQKRQSDL
ncbi:hypothetical protein BGZ92_006717 [Podila epicladia]|nr:hypothetical protein BGZ92_006717 [Podila epicladia]